MDYNKCVAFLGEFLINFLTEYLPTNIHLLRILLGNGLSYDTSCIIFGCFKNIA